jgi:hypothetical protein
MDKLLISFIEPYTDGYIEGLNKEQLIKSISSGNIVLDDLKLNPGILDKLGINFPIRLIDSSIGKIKINIPWLKIMTDGLSIDIDGVSLSFTITKEEEWLNLDSISYKNKLAYLQGFSNTIIKHLENHFFKNTGFFNFAMFSSITDNLKISLSNLTIKLIYQDNELGIRINKIAYLNTDEAFSKSILAVKNAEYGYKLVSMENFCIYNKDYSKEAFILQPVNLKLEVKVKSQIKGNEHKFSFNLVLDNVNLLLEKRQVDLIIAMLNEYLYYKKKIFQYSQYKKFLIFRPRLDGDRKEYVLNMWRFVFRMTKKLNRYYKGDAQVFDIAESVKGKYKASFIDFYTKYKSNIISPDEERRLKWMTDILDTDTLCNWISGYITDMFIELKKSKSQAKGVFNLFGLAAEKKVEEVKLTNDEVNKINELILRNIEVGLDENELVPRFELTFTSKNIKFDLLNEKLSQNLSIDLSRIIYKLYYGKENFNLSLVLGQLYIQFIEKQKKYPITYNNGISDNDDLVVINIDKEIQQDKETMKINANVNKINFLYGNYLTIFILCYLKCHITNELIRLIIEHWSRLKFTATESLKKYLNYQSNITFEIGVQPINLLLPTRSDLETSSLFVINFNKFKVFKEAKSIILMKFEDINVTYFNSINDYQRDTSNRTDVIKNLAFDNQLSYKYLGNNQDERNYSLSSNVQNLNLIFTSEVYKSLFILFNSFQLENQGLLKINPELVNIPTTEIKSNAVLSGYVLKLNNLIKTWEVYYIYISGGFVYFYNSTNDEDYIFRVYINEESMKISIEEDMIIMSSISFYVHMKMQQGDSKTIKQEDFIKAINQQLSDNIWEEVDTKHNLVKTNTNFYAHSKSNIKNDILHLECIFTFNELNVSLSENNLVPIANIRLNQVNYFMYLNNQNEIEIDFSIMSIAMKTLFSDVLVHYARDDPFIFTKIRIYDNKSIKFVDSICNFDIRLQDIVIYYRPELIQSLIKLFKIDRNLTYVNEDRKNMLKINEERIITCIDYSENAYKNIAINVDISKVNVILMQESMDFMFYDIDISGVNFTSSVYYDHYMMTFDLSKFEISDLTGYPNTIKSQHEFNINDRNVLISSPNKVSFIMIYYDKSCPLERKASEDTYLKLNLTSPVFYYYYQPYERLFDYVYNEYDKIEFKIYEKLSLEISFIRLDIELTNPLIVLKDRKQSKDSLIFDFGNIVISNKYEYESENKLDILYQNIFLDMKGMSFKSIINNKQFYMIKGINMKSKLYYQANENDPDEFRLLKSDEEDMPTNLTHFIYEIEKVNINIRQLDLHYVIRFFDMNLNFNDGNSKLFKLKDKTGRIANKSFSETILTINEINVNLLIDFNHYLEDIDSSGGMVSYFKVNLNDLVMIQKVLDKDTTTFTIGEIFITNHYKDKTEFILQNNKRDAKDYQVELTIESNEYNESFWNLSNNNFKFLFKLDNILLLNDYFVNAAPDYNDSELHIIQNKKKQFQNLGDWVVNMNMNKTCFIMLSDNDSNLNQTIICSNIDQVCIIFKHMKRKKVIDRIQIDGGKDVVLDISMTLEKVDIYITKFYNFQVNNCDKRYLMQNTDSIYILRFKNYVRNDRETHNFIDEYTAELDIEALNFQLSYTDIVTFLYSYNSNLACLSSDDYTRRKDLLKALNFEFNDLNNIVLIDKFNMTEIVSTIVLKKISITLIDDNANVYYPFLCLRLNSLDANIMSSEITRATLLDTFIYLEVLSYNYIASTWEPMLENSAFNLNFKIERKDMINKTLIAITTGNRSMPLKFNISDINVKIFVKLLVHIYLLIP